VPANTNFFEPAGCLVRAAFKEKKMKRTISLWLGLLAFALLPVLAQTSAPLTGKIHGHVTSPTGAPYTVGTVNLSSDGGRTTKFTFPVSSAGNFAGEAAPGTYMLLFRLPDTPPDKMVDQVESVKVVLGQDVEQDIDMSRKEFVDALPSETRKQLEELRKKNAEAMKANELIKNLNADIKVVLQDFKDAGVAKQTATQALGAAASRADIEAKENEIKTAKFTEAETLMLKDSAAKPDASVLWAQLGQAQIGLKKYDDAEVSYKKTLELEAASKKPSTQTQGAANAGLGEIYARAGKVAEANAAYDAAAKIDPPKANFYLGNESVIFSQMGNGDAQTAAAEEAIAADPAQPLPYYLKGQGLIQKATVDPATGKMVLPPGCAEAYQKYLQLAPNGTYAADVKGILDQASNMKIDSSYKAAKPSKK
jgi:tetratricopeptide (TPR) repeat protein